MWSESPRVASGDSPGRASLPITRMKNVPVDASPGEPAALRAFALQVAQRWDAAPDVVRRDLPPVARAVASVYVPECRTGSSTPSSIAVPRKRTDATAMNGRRPTRNRTPIVDGPGRTELISASEPTDRQLGEVAVNARSGPQRERAPSSAGNRPPFHASGSTNPVVYSSVITRVTARAAGRSLRRPNALSGHALALHAPEVEREAVAHAGSATPAGKSGRGGLGRLLRAGRARRSTSEAVTARRSPTVVRGCRSPSVHERGSVLTPSTRRPRAWCALSASASARRRPPPRSSPLPW